MTLHVSDIRADIARGDTNGIRDAFRAVVGYPKEDTIVGADADTLVDLLGQLCDAVQGDEGLLPGDFANDLRDRFDQDGEVLVRGTYAEAGEAVRPHLQAFAALARAFFSETAPARA